MQKKPFVPTLLPIKVDYNNLVDSIAAAHRALAALDALLNHIPNPKLLARTLQTKEAVLSSKIEGTLATLSDVFVYEAGDSAPGGQSRQDDITEILNYRRALETGVRHLQNKPLSVALIKKLHAVLLSTGRGHTKTPGKLRTAQVYIGRPGTRIEDASFVPPPPRDIVRLLANLQEYLHGAKEKDPLVQIAVAHYQFEAIHPFLDGNGRVGRLLVSLFLFERGLLAHPFLYLSEYFEAHRQSYYELLRAVSEKNDWEQWIVFFLKALAAQARDAQRVAKDILKLRDRLGKKVAELNTAYGAHLLDALFTHPVFSTASIRKDAGIKNTQSFFNVLKKFVDAGIVVPTAPEKKRNKVYAFSELLGIVNR